MPLIDRGAFRINYEIACDGGGPTLVLVAGLGEQIGSVEYPEAQCEAFARLGFRVIQIDNRDAGLSLPVSTDTEIPAYTLHDLADDTCAVISDLASGPVHLLGASMGGFIVRWAAIRRPDLIKTLTVVMSGSGAGLDDDGPQLNPKAQPSLMGMFERRDRAAEIEWSVENWRWLWGISYPFPRDWVRSRVAASYDRSYRPEGVARLLNASRNTPGLWDAQTEISCPTLVIHGGEDPIFPTAHGEAIAERIPGANLWLDPKMGHIMHEEQWGEMATRAAALADKAVNASA